MAEGTKVVKGFAFSQKYLDSLSEEDREQANGTVALVNRLLEDLTNHNGEYPPPPTVITKNISIGASKIANNGVKALLQQKPHEAVKLLSTALEMVLRRPLWEQTIVVLEEIASCLMPRCDAYVSLKQWADAYADASLLMLIKPQDPMNHYRKGMILISAGRRSEARDFLSTAVRMAPSNNVFQTALRSVSDNQ